MAGGTFLSQNKLRPGAYINFKAVSAPAIDIGSRGVAAMPLATGWGPDFIELYSTELLNGKSIQKVGVSYVDDDALIYRLVLSHTYKLLIARTDLTSAAAASATIGNLVVDAKYKGIVGNRISIIISKLGDTSVYDVTTALDGIGKDTQRITAINQLVNNDWVNFSVDDPEESMTPTATAGTALTGGVSGTETQQSLTDAIQVLATKNFNVLGCMSSEATVKSYVKATIKQLREDEGKKCRAVVLDYAGLSGADYEGIVSCKQGYKTKTGEVTAAEFVAELTGLSAGADLGESLTHRAIEGAIEIVGAPQTNAEIIEALKTGNLVLSQLSDNTVVIEEDINTLCNDFTDKDQSFTKNVIINTLDEIGNTIQLTWDKTYCGKVPNNERRREIFKAALIQYFRLLESNELIADFNKETDITIEQGESLDSVVVNWWCKPVDVMEKLYMTTYVRRA